MIITMAMVVGDDDDDGELNKKKNEIKKRRLRYTNVVDSIEFLYHCL